MTNTKFINRINLSLFFLLGCLSTVPGVVAPNILKTFDLNNAEGAFLLGVWSGGFVLGSAVSGVFLRRLGLRNTFMLFSSLIAVPSFLMNSLGTYDLYLCMYCVMAFSVGVLITLGHTLTALSNQGSIASGLTLADLAVSVGNLASPYLVVLLVQQHIDWRMPHIVFGMYAALVLMFAFIKRNVLPDVHSSPELNSNTQSSKSANVFYSFWVPMLMMMAVSFVLHAVEWGHSMWNTIYVAHVAKISENEARVVYSLFLIGMVLARVINISMAKRFSAKALIGTGTIIMSISFSGLLYLQDSWLIALANLCFGFGFGALFPNIMGSFMQKNLHMVPVLSSIAMFSGACGSYFMAYLLGRQIDKYGIGNLYSTSYSIVMFAFVILIACSILYISRTGFYLGNARKQINTVM